MFIRNAWYVAAWAEEVAGEPLGRTLLNEPVVIFRDPSGSVAALEDRCCHRAAALSMGRVGPKGLACGYHGLVFDRSGKCVEVPGQTRIPERACVRSYPVVEKDEFIWIWMGDAEKADPSLIVDYPFNNDHANWPHKRSVLPVACDYQLLVDNLMDLTHLGYVHSTTIGGDPSTHVNAEMKVSRTKNGVRYIRWMLDAAPPPTYAKAVPLAARVDRWQEFELYAPSNVLQFSGALDAGTGAYDLGKREGGFALRIFHGVTPETDSTCLYFWTAANGYRTSDPAATESLHEQIAFTFNEDKAFLEAQQKRMQGTDPGRLVDIQSDGPRVLVGRHLRQLLAQERAVEAEVPIVRSPAVTP